MDKNQGHFDISHLSIIPHHFRKEPHKWGRSTHRLAAHFRKEVFNVSSYYSFISGSLNISEGGDVFPSLEVNLRQAIPRFPST